MNNLSVLSLRPGIHIGNHFAARTILSLLLPSGKFILGLDIVVLDDTRQCVCFFGHHIAAVLTAARQSVWCSLIFQDISLGNERPTKFDL